MLLVYQEAAMVTLNARGVTFHHGPWRNTGGILATQAERSWVQD